MRVIAFLPVISALVVVPPATGFRQQPTRSSSSVRPSLSHGGNNPFLSLRHQSTAIQMGMFDGFIKSMEAGYDGGDKSLYAQRKKEDERKRAKQRQKSDARKARGFTELKDVYGKKTFVETKYDFEDLPERTDPISKMFGGFFERK